MTTHTRPGSQEPHLSTAASGSRVIECPLLQGDELFGILCVGVDDLSESQLQEHLAFLQTLSIIGGVSLQLAGRKEGKRADEKVEALHRASGEFDPDAFRQSEEMALLAAEFAVKIGMAQETAKSVLQACQLVCYSPEFIRGTFPDSRISDILEEGNALAGGEPSGNEQGTEPEAVIFALVQGYIRNDYRLEAVAHLERVDESIYQQFLSFIRSSHVTETELDLTDMEAADEESATVTEAIRNLSALSPREREVLSLITEGMNNREIAEELFISDHTVKNHVTKIFQKLEVSDRAHAISKVYRSMYAKKNG
ncbi:response regulator transcription factor [Indiicoccus explosivorum]|uniref:response regulator transcription factor n=1 Tax=Indiicoccus explosivorum TaxID=1917864 RepID=UPI001F4D6C4C|nr:LuxR C-terminal-related transcriptional regulator [Indiicoccus explosivorum]